MNFPYTLYNKQLIAAEEIIKLFLQGYPHVLLDAPTGSGKSIIALYVAIKLQELEDKGKLRIGYKNDLKVGLITKSINLQEQYIESEVYLDNLMGKTNYACHVSPGIVYDSDKCFMDRNDCISKCAYLTKRRNWQKSNLRLTNFAFAIEACDLICNKSGKDGNRSDLLIIDESHSIANELMERSVIKFDLEQIKSLSKIDENNKSKIAIEQFEYVQYLLKSHLKNFMLIPNVQLKKKLKIPKTVFSSSYDYFIGMANDKSYTKRERLLYKQAGIECSILSDFLDILINSNKDSKFVLSNSNEYKAIFAHDVAEYGLFKKANHFLHMTATFCGKDQYMKNLGLDDLQVVTMKSDFPLENRPNYVFPMGKIDQIDQDLVDGLDAIIENYPNLRGNIHSVSYDRATTIKRLSKFGHLIEIPTTRQEINRLMKSNKKDMIIVSPAISTGYDFKDDLARFQIILKVPYKFMGDQWVKMLYKYNKDFYFNEALCELIQMSGRGVRNKDDYCDTFIVDSRFGGMAWFQRNDIPKWFADSLIDV